MFKVMAGSLLATLAMVGSIDTLAATTASNTDKPALDLSKSFTEQKREIEADLADGKTYSEISSKDRAEVAAAISRISGAIGSASTVEELSEADRIAVFNDQEVINGILTKARRDSRVVCTHEKKVGSHRSTARCLTVAERERAREQSQDALRNNAGYRLPQGN